MMLRSTRRRCGLAFGLLLTWSGAPDRARADEAAAPEEAKAAPALIELSGATELGAAPLATERVQERHPNRTLKTERVVAQDESGNYFNHGTYVAWNEEGRMSGRGEYRHDLREGKWTRWFTIAETEEKYGHLLELGFKAPFTSQADFAGGELHGAWTIVDAKQRPVAAWEFENGVRHGLSAWYYPDGKKYREAEYTNGDLDGVVREYSPNEKLAKEEKFAAGHRIGVQVEYYDTGELKSECEMVFSKLETTANDDWWNGTTEIKVCGRVGQDQRHGKYQAWDRGGHLILAGAYVDDLPNGKFIWWFSNGTKAIEGGYIDGKQNGPWTWYHENGLKEIVGEYVMGYEAGKWLMWGEDGRVTETLTIHGGASEDPVVTGQTPMLVAPLVPQMEVPQVAPASAVEESTPAPEAVQRVTFEQTPTPPAAVPQAAVPETAGEVKPATGSEAKPEAKPAATEAAPSTPVEVTVKMETDEAIYIEQDDANLAPAAKTILKPVAERPEPAKDGS